MKGINQYNFDIIHVATHLRDTLEYVLPHEHDVKVYDKEKRFFKKALNQKLHLEDS